MERVVVLRPELLIPFVTHNATTFGTSMLVPDADVVTHTFRAKPSVFRGETRSYIGNHATDGKGLNLMAMHTNHHGDLLSEESPAFVEIA